MHIPNSTLQLLHAPHPHVVQNPSLSLLNHLCTSHISHHISFLDPSTTDEFLCSSSLINPANPPKFDFSTSHQSSPSPSKGPHLHFARSELLKAKRSLMPRPLSLETQIFSHLTPLFSSCRPIPPQKISLNSIYFPPYPLGIKKKKKDRR